MVSKDRTQLKEKCDKIDKQRAERLSEIHHMQERVRFSMRNLAIDKLHLKKRQHNERAPGVSKELESGYFINEKGNLYEDDASKDYPQKHQDGLGQARKNLDIPNVNTSQRRSSAPSSVPQSSPKGIISRDHATKRKGSDFHKSETNKEFIQKHLGFDVPSKSLDIPQSDPSKRRASAPLSLPQPGSPKNREFSIKTTSCQTVNGFGRLTLSSSLPKELYTSTSKRKLSKTLDKSNMLSINDIRMSARSPVVNLHRKSSVNLRGDRRLSDASRSFRDFSPNRHENENRPRSLSVAYVGNLQAVSAEPPRKLSGGGPKGQLFRTRSRSLPDLLSPTHSKGSKSASSPVKLKESANNEDQDISESALARSFEQLKHCRYLRSTVPDPPDVTEQ